ncbi:rCG63452 [Rattus norvegicus]|uniref:RCG63452 n=1 Tax=Rattus norvegicus TaxID=10116 RepID=A6HB83_RAT|nr:rCG63452 [Rattus norvegicus]
MKSVISEPPVPSPFLYFNDNFLPLLNFLLILIDFFKSNRHHTAFSCVSLCAIPIHSPPIPLHLQFLTVNLGK